ncbi:MAG: DUF4126 domain-containing protein [Verrucomicrobiota bacterium]
MTLIDQLGIALGLATLAGLNLYLTVLVAGCAVRFHWIELSGAYEQMAVLGHPWVLGVAGVLFLVEFFADKMPWVDSMWDAAHTLIRPAGAIFLTLAVLGKMDPVAVTVAVLLAGTAALSTHGTKSGIRAFLNLSPEPVSNTVASVTEDGLVLGGLGLIGLAPAVALFFFIGLVVLCTAAAIWLWKRIFRLRRAGGEVQRACGDGARG